MKKCSNGAFAQTLSGLQEDAPARRISGRRMMLIAAALVLMLAAAVAAAAGWMRSAKYDAKLLAQQALYDKYGFTREMDSFFICTVEENDGETVVTYHANEDVGELCVEAGRLYRDDPKRSGGSELVERRRSRRRRFLFRCLGYGIAGKGHRAQKSRGRMV